MVGDERAYPGWVPVVCPWQPSSLDPRGYLAGCARPTSSVTTPAGTTTPRRTSPGRRPGPDGRADLALAREHLGLPYLWGGTSPSASTAPGWSTWCTELGRVLPRDAHDQQAATEPVDPADALPGDLYFFARPGERCTTSGSSRARTG